jgi:hypothetical protein
MMMMESPAESAGLPEQTALYEKYEAELAQGAFEANEDDIGEDLVTFVEPLSSMELAGIVVPPTTIERLHRSLSALCPADKVKSVEELARERASSVYRGRVLSNCESLQRNSILCKDMKDPGDSFGERRIYEQAQCATLKRDILRLRSQLALLKKKNSDLENHIDILSKCRDTLILDDVAARNFDVLAVGAEEYNKQMADVKRGYKEAMARLEGRVVPK